MWVYRGVLRPARTLVRQAPLAQAAKRAAARHECALEKAAPLGVEQLLKVQLKLRAIVIVPCAHGL